MKLKLYFLSILSHNRFQYLMVMSWKPTLCHPCLKYLTFLDSPHFLLNNTSSKSLFSFFFFFFIILFCDFFVRYFCHFFHCLRLFVEPFFDKTGKTGCHFKFGSVELVKVAKITIYKHFPLRGSRSALLLDPQQCEGDRALLNKE